MIDADTKALLAAVGELKPGGIYLLRTSPGMRNCSAAFESTMEGLADAGRRFRVEFIVLGPDLELLQGEDLEACPQFREAIRKMVSDQIAEQATICPGCAARARAR